MRWVTRGFLLRAALFAGTIEVGIQVIFNLDRSLRGHLPLVLLQWTAIITLACCMAWCNSRVLREAERRTNHVRWGSE